MCGRYTLTVSPAELETWFGAQAEGVKILPTWNAAPGQDLPVLLKTDHAWFAPMRWGFSIPVGGGQSFVINARSETVTSKSTFKHLASGFRCVIPATGFFEWKKRGSEKIPYYIHFPHHPLYGMAGIYRPETLDQDAAFLILTTEPKGIIRTLHERMPLILDQEGVAEWLRNGQDPELRLNLSEQSRAFTAEAYSVSSRVNRIANNGPELLRPEEHTAPLTLFD
jgi:putative SOS response-associated peptidase YedK